jgi:hypothetical protein
LLVSSDCDDVEEYISMAQGKAEPHLDADIQGMCESNLTSKSQLISRNLDLVLVSSDGDDVEEYGSTGHGPQGMFFCYTSYSHINLAGLRYQCCPACHGCVFS